MISTISLKRAKCSWGRCMWVNIYTATASIDLYAAGFSGGARMSSLLGFYQSDVFHGTIQNCGTDFYRAVPMVAATSAL